MIICQQAANYQTNINPREGDTDYSKFILSPQDSPLLNDLEYQGWDWYVDVNDDPNARI